MLRDSVVEDEAKRHFKTALDLAKESRNMRHLAGGRRSVTVAVGHRVGPFSPPAREHQFVWVPRAGAEAGAADCWNEADLFDYISFFGSP